MFRRFAALAAISVLAPLPVLADPTTESVYDEALAQRVQADERGMRAYVFVLLRTGPKKMPAGPERDAMFQGHFANIKRLSHEGRLLLAGPFDGVDGWRGMFIFAGRDIDEVRRLTETDPVIRNGEMVAEYHSYYGSAALAMIPELHPRLARKAF